MDAIPEALWAQALAARDEVASAMIGRLGDPARPAAAVAAAVGALAGDGDCCETGVLWGGSLLTTALLRKRLGLRGVCVGVDPLDGYYVGAMPRPGMTPQDNAAMPAPVTVETVIENARRLGLDEMVELVPARSHPWPAMLAVRSFVAGFIDGDHWDDGPFNDFMNLAARGARVIAFDNYPDGSYPDGIDDVARAVARALDETPAWALAFVLHGVAVLERVAPAEQEETDDAYRD